jgi:hypothetical protein
MKLVIHSVSCWDHPNIRTWEPRDPDDVAEELTVDIGPRGKNTADSFILKIATPKGLCRLPAHAGIVATRPLVVLERYDFQVLWHWLEETVASCERDTWEACVAELRLHFLWEYEGMAH